MTERKRKKKTTKITSDLQIKIHGDLFTSNSNSIDQILTELSISVQSLQKVFLSLLPAFSQNLNLLRILWWKVLIRISHWYSLCKSNLEYEFSGSRAYISRGLGLQFTMLSLSLKEPWKCDQHDCYLVFNNNNCKLAHSFAFNFPCLSHGSVP